MKRRWPRISRIKEEGVLRMRHAPRRKCYGEGCVMEGAGVAQTITRLNFINRHKWIRNNEHKYQQIYTISHRLISGG